MPGLLTRLPSSMLPGGYPTVAAPVSVSDANVYYVSSIADNRADDPAHGFTPLRPFATWDYAIGRASAERRNTSQRGDTIVLMENHAETITTATALAMDVAGIRVVGQGHGLSMPTITFTTITSASCYITAADCEIANVRFVNGYDSQSSCINIDGSSDGAYIHDNVFVEGSATTPLAFIVMSGVADDVRIERNSFYLPTAANGDYAIQIAAGGAPVRLVIKDNFIYGDFDLAGIGSTNAFTSAMIVDNRIVNLQAGQFAIEFTGAATGVIDGNFLGTDAQATALDPGSTYVGTNPWNATGDTTAQNSLPAVDVGTNFIGVDDADNVAATTNVVRNQDGSILERLESVQASLDGTAGIATWPAAAAPADAVSLAEGLRYAVENQMFRLVTKSYIASAGSNSVGTVSLFTVSGTVEIQGMYATVTTAPTSTSTLEVGATGNTAVFIAQITDATQMAANEIWHDATPTTTIEAVDLFGARHFIVTNGQDAILTIGSATLSPTTTQIEFYAWWRPISSTGALVAA